MLAIPLSMKNLSYALTKVIYNQFGFATMLDFKISAINLVIYILSCKPFLFWSKHAGLRKQGWTFTHARQPMACTFAVGPAKLKKCRPDWPVHFDTHDKW